MNKRNVIKIIFGKRIVCLFVMITMFTVMFTGLAAADNIFFWSPEDGNEVSDVVEVVIGSEFQHNDFTHVLFEVVGQGGSYVSERVEYIWAYDPLYWEFDSTLLSDGPATIRASAQYEYQLIWFTTDVEEVNVIIKNENEVQLRMITPNGGEVCRYGKHTIQWYSAIPEFPVNIYVSRNYSPWEEIALNVPNNGCYEWTVTPYFPVSEHCIIKICYSGLPSYYDVSDNYFTIAYRQPRPIPNSISIRIRDEANYISK